MLAYFGVFRQVYAESREESVRRLQMDSRVEPVGGRVEKQESSRGDAPFRKEHAEGWERQEGRVRSGLPAGGYIYASSTAGLFYFMNRNISRDNWTRGAVTAKLSAYGDRAYRVPPYETIRNHTIPPPTTIATTWNEEEPQLRTCTRSYTGAFLRHNARMGYTSLIHFNATNAVQQRRIVPRGHAEIFPPLSFLPRSARARPFCSRHRGQSLAGYAAAAVSGCLRVPMG